MNGLQYIRECYGVPAKRGQRVKWGSHTGRIVGASSGGAYLRVRLDGPERDDVVIVHPRDDDLEYIREPGGEQR